MFSALFAPWSTVTSAVTSAAPLVLFAFTMCATPGPNNAMLAASGANFSLRRSLPHMAGIATGFSLMMLLVALGIGQALRSAPSVYAALRWVGAAYLLWLAWQIARAEPAKPNPAKPHPANPATRPQTMLGAALFQWVNPKAWIIIMGAATTYTPPGSPVLRQSVLNAAVFFLVGWPAFFIWAAIGAGAARLLRTPAGLRAFNWAMAALLVVSLVPILTE